MSALVDQTAADPDARERIELAWRWLNDFPVNPHPDLGRTGPVCPYMGRALDRRLVELFAFDARTGDDAFIARAYALRKEFEQHSATVDDGRTYLVYFVIPYGLPEPELKAMVERVHAQLRPEFVQGGMLAGDFWPEHQTGGLHSTSFRPFASPLPIFGMRNMVPGDLAFFASPEVPPDVQLTYIGYYRRAFDGALPPYWQQQLATAEQAARAAIAGDPPSADPVA